MPLKCINEFLLFCFLELTVGLVTFNESVETVFDGNSIFVDEMPSFLDIRQF